MAKFDWNNVQLIVLKDKKYIYGSLIKGELREEEEFKTLKLVKEKLPTNLIKPIQWLKKRDLSEELEKDLFSVLKSSEIFILSPPIEPSNSEWDKFWFTSIAEKCKNCSKKCKESGMVVVDLCKDFKEMGVK